MPLGWIDFSKSDRNKVLSVLDSLTEKGTVDELGIGVIRDGFANIFFPGTSTVQTRAKYLLIVPYALKDMEHISESNPNKLLTLFDEVEKQCSRQLLENDDTDGVIGKIALSNNTWVKRTPSTIYWSSIRNYGIFVGGNLSVFEYFRVICEEKREKNNLINLANRNDERDSTDNDDKNAGGYFYKNFWNIPTYSNDWKENLDIKLTKDEGHFLKKQIITSYPDSMMAYILKYDKTELLACRTFQKMHSMMNIFPKDLQRDYQLALSFSDFVYVLRVIYNIIISDGKNKTAYKEWENLEPNLRKYAKTDLDGIFDRLLVRKEVKLCRFLRNCREYMYNKDLDELKKEICIRECDIKTSRAKTKHPGMITSWYGGGKLDYRFNYAKVIMKDIFESEGLNVKSK